MRIVFAAATALSLLTGTVTTAHANGREDRQEWSKHDRDHDGKHGRGDRHDGRHDRHYDRDHDRGRHYSRHYDRRDWRHDSRHWDHRDYRAGYAQGRYDQRRYDRGRYVPPRGYHYRSWRYGDRLPVAYYSRRYIVNDYHVYRLRPPPRGYHWVRVDNDVVLAAIAGGIVAEVVTGLFY